MWTQPQAMDIIANSRVISGPLKLFDGSFIIEFIEPDPSLDASVLIKATYVVDHPLNQMGKSNPQSPPLHLHFDQSETFQIVQGRIGTTIGWSATDRIFTDADDACEIKPMVPHRFWPVASEPGQKDCIMLVRAHPKNTPESMDDVFFEVLLRVLDDAHKKGKAPDLLQLMLTQHKTASALVWFPRVSWLGSLRWQVPWVLQGGFAALAPLLGYKPLPAEFFKKRV